MHIHVFVFVIFIFWFSFLPEFCYPGFQLNHFTGSKVVINSFSFTCKRSESSVQLLAGLVSQFLTPPLFRSACVMERQKFGAGCSTIESTTEMFAIFYLQWVL